MSLWRLLFRLYARRKGALALALALSLLTVAAGVGLLGVSGWFLTGAALIRCSCSCWRRLRWRWRAAPS
ncbi:ABC transporter ATP-binding protein [Bordetella pertussis]|nr:ABC transporter ATP-binding protein [Bordetella pertussis]